MILNELWTYIILIYYIKYSAINLNFLSHSGNETCSEKTGFWNDRVRIAEKQIHGKQILVWVKLRN